MSLNTSGPMSIGGTVAGQSINVELGLSPTANSSIGQSNFRGLAKVPTGEISLDDFYGKSNVIIIPPISVNTADFTLSSADISGYISGQTTVEVVIDENVYVYSTDTLKAALTFNNFALGDQINIVNNGFIMGKGGNGGYVQNNGEGQPPTYIPATNGGAAIVSFPVKGFGQGVHFNVTNNGYIGGGGGGGAGNAGGGGGGAGGGNGGLGLGEYPGGAGGSIGTVGATGTNAPPELPVANGGTGGGAGGGAGAFGLMGGRIARGGGGGGGGRIFPGTGGVGGLGQVSSAGGNGGAVNQNGQPGQTNSGGVINGGCGGGGWGASGASSPPSGRSGGVGGRAIQLNGATATVVVFGFIYGSIG